VKIQQTAEPNGNLKIKSSKFMGLVIKGKVKMKQQKGENNRKIEEKKKLKSNTVIKGKPRKAFDSPATSDQPTKKYKRPSEPNSRLNQKEQPMETKSEP
jgi:hypothetical protein